jgi:hypothetical protein
MKKALIAFGCLETILILAFVLFVCTNRYAWLYPLLLTLIGASTVAGIALLIFGKKR